MGVSIRGEASAQTICFNGKDYGVDLDGFLIDPATWDENFAKGMAPEAGIPGEVSEKQWEVIRLIRRFWEERGLCPTVYQTCRILGLHVAGFGFLFPKGYQEGACKLAGVSHKAGHFEDVPKAQDMAQATYRIDVWGFLIDPDEWDERFALLKAREMKVPGGLTTDHWEVLRFLRQEYFRIGKIPTISEACEAMGLDLSEFEALFPDGYYRGAVKIAGLRAGEDL
jgi:tRNA 2-thiouridine synthesizing protein E